MRCVWEAARFLRRRGPAKTVRYYRGDERVYLPILFNRCLINAPHTRMAELGQSGEPPLGQTCASGTQVQTYGTISY